MSMTDNAKIYYLTQVFALVILASILMLGLLPALLGGLLVYFLVELGARQLGRAGILPSYARLICLALITLLSVTGIGFAVMGRRTKCFSRIIKTERMMALWVVLHLMKMLRQITTIPSVSSKTEPWER